MDKLRMESPDLTAQNIDRIAALFPNCITEMLDEEHSKPEKKVYKRAVNFELLKQMLSPDVVDGDEAYEFTWVGKKAAIVEANKPIRKTLRPCMAESKDWDTTENLYIEGDNLEVLKLLQESYLGKVKMIYIDPPYNTGNDFIYADDFMRSQEEENEQMGMYDEDENRLFKNTDTNGRFHSDWCSMIYSRLMLARNLLTDDGVIFISIDDNEVDDLMKIANDVFGKDNFLACFPRVTKKAGKTTDVAVSRAVHSLAVVTSQDPRNDQTNYGDLTRYIEYNNFAVIQSQVYSVFDMLYQGYAEQRRAYLQKHKRVSEYDSENLMYSVIQEVLSDEEFSSIGCAVHVSLATLVKDYEPLTEEENKYARNPLTHVDFLLFNQMDKQPMLAIEVDGTGFHEAGSKQAERDMKKNSILEKCGVPLLRLRTDGSGEKEKIKNALKGE